LDLDAVQILPGEAVVLPRLGRTIWALQIEHRLAAPADDVDMRRAMIIRLDHHTQAAKAQDCQHV